jgi:hypothetical protein
LVIIFGVSLQCNIAIHTILLIMFYEKLEVLAHTAETENEIADAKTAVLGSEKLISEDEQYELLNLLNAKQDALEEEEENQYRAFLADANSHYLATR